MWACFRDDSVLSSCSCSVRSIATGESSPRPMRLAPCCKGKDLPGAHLLQLLDHLNHARRPPRRLLIQALFQQDSEGACAKSSPVLPARVRRLEQSKATQAGKAVHVG